MYRMTLCLGTGPSFGVSTEEQIKLFRQAGFEAFFTDWNENVAAYRKLADELGMIYQSVHAPFSKAAALWQEGEAAEQAVAELLRCVDDCAENGVPILIVHPYIGFDGPYLPTETGLKNFGAVVNAARQKGVKIAFENVEGEEYLAALMEAFADYENVGFCWDTGHEQCYNYGKDMLSLYGDRLIATHINDNLGVSRADGTIHWTDDLHLLPFDGVNDWDDVAARLCRHGYDGILTFELKRNSNPGRHDADKYAALPVEQYVAEAYARACRLAVKLEHLRRG